MNIKIKYTILITNKEKFTKILAKIGHFMSLFASVTLTMTFKKVILNILS